MTVLALPPKEFCNNRVNLLSLYGTKLPLLPFSPNAFIQLPNTNIELLEPLGDNSPIAKYLNKNINGGVHHICYEVHDIELAIEKLKKNKCKVLGDGIPREGAHGKPVIFVHPSSFNGTLIELEQI